jgi:hypothetical protein
VLLVVGVIRRVGCVVGESGERGESGAADVEGRDVNVQIDFQEGHHWDDEGERSHYIGRKEG